MIDIIGKNFDLFYTKWISVKLPKNKLKKCPICKNNKGDMGLVQAQQDVQTNIKPVKDFRICGECISDILQQNSEIKTFVEHEIEFVFFDDFGDESEPFVFTYNKKG